MARSSKKSPARRPSRRSLPARSSAQKRAKKPNIQELSRDVWPQERDVISRPERLKYVRKLIKNDGCVFCRARDLGPSLESLCVYKNEHAMVVLNKYPYNSGHVMVLPARHCGDLTELSSVEWSAVHGLLLETVKAVQASYDIAGLNMGLNMGSVAGAGLPDHLHWHIVPRWSGDTNFFPLIAETKVVSESLEDVYAKYLRYFQGLK